MRLNDLAYLRSGDKGDTSNVAVLARDQDAYDRIAATMTPEAIGAFMGDSVTGEIAVYTLPQLRAFNVVMHGALGGGATATLRIDETGKAMGCVLSRMEV